jgi:hypothetical protein
VLKVGSVLMLISIGNPEERLFHLQRSHLSFEIEQIALEMKTDDCTVVHWIYLCKKKADFERAEKCWSMEKFKIHDEEGLGSDFEDDTLIEDNKPPAEESIEERITDIINEGAVKDND